MTPTDDQRGVLRDGELTVLGRIRPASNATFLCESMLDERSVHCVYKPVSGEQPLWDFPDGTLAGRELAAYLISKHLGWNIVPYTIIRHGPAGPGMLQLWVEQPSDTVATADSEPRPGPDLVDLFPADKREPGYLPVLRAYDYAGDEVMLMHADDIRLWRMAVFDVLINNADRKGGHVLRDLDGHIYGVDHGVCPPAPLTRSGWLVAYTFSANVAPAEYGAPVRASSAGMVTPKTSVSWGSWPKSPSNPMVRLVVVTSFGYSGIAGLGGSPSSAVASPWPGSVAVDPLATKPAA